MSEENKESIPKSNEGSQETEKFVTRKAYEEVSGDMHKYKTALKEREAVINQLEAERKAKEEESLLQQSKFKELWEQEKEEKQRLVQEGLNQKQMYLDTVKKSALKNELGNIKDVYLSFADLNSISFNDSGSIERESLEAVANKFRADHAELLPKSGQANITSIPAGTVNNQTATVEVGQMSKDQLIAKLIETQKNK